MGDHGKRKKLRTLARSIFKNSKKPAIDNTQSHANSSPLASRSLHPLNSTLHSTSPDNLNVSIKSLVTATGQSLSKVSSGDYPHHENIFSASDRVNRLPSKEVGQMEMIAGDFGDGNGESASNSIDGHLGDEPNERKPTLESTRSSKFGFGSRNCSCETCSHLNLDRRFDRQDADDTLVEKLVPETSSIIKGSCDNGFERCSKPTTAEAKELELYKGSSDAFNDVTDTDGEDSYKDDDDTSGPPVNEDQSDSSRGVPSETSTSFYLVNVDNHCLSEAEIVALREYNLPAAKSDHRIMSDDEFQALPAYADVEYDEEYNLPNAHSRRRLICASATPLPVSDSIAEWLNRRYGEEAVEHVWKHLFRKGVDVGGELVNMKPATKRKASWLSTKDAGRMYKKRRACSNPMFEDPTYGPRNAIKAGRELERNAESTITKLTQGLAQRTLYAAVAVFFFLCCALLLREENAFSIGFVLNGYGS